jgi:hypothetical protein
MFRIGLCAAGAAIALSGCASQLPVTGNETSVVIGGTADVATAFPLAEKHCANYGKVAHFKHVEGFRVEFDCDPKP